MSGKMKKANKGHEAKSKARDLIILDFHDFLVFLESLDVVYWQELVFWCFDVEKAKKATT